MFPTLLPTSHIQDDGDVFVMKSSSKVNGCGEQQRYSSLGSLLLWPFLLSLLLQEPLPFP